MYLSKYVKASNVFKKFTLENYKYLYNLGIFPINDIFEPLFTNDYDIALLYGGRGGGKSDALAFHLIEECENSDYFKCYYGRQIYDTVRESAHATIISAIKLLNKENDFTFSETPNGSLNIVHKKTGNKFIAFGGDKPQKLKSIKDPTHVWLEESDQFSLNLFSELGATLRTLRGKNRMYLSFNTKDVLDDHWIRKVFFSDEEVEEKTILKIFANFTDNYFIDRDKYFAQLRLNSAGNENVLNAIAYGAWGVVEIDNPFCYAFDEQKHTGYCEIDYNYPIWLSFDFNRNPICCSVIQHYDNIIHVVKAYKLSDSDIYKLCDHIWSDYGVNNPLFLVTGDASGAGSNALVKDNINYYTVIKQKLHLADGQMKQPRVNPRLEENQVLVNALLANYQWVIDKENSKAVIFDMKYVKMLPDGTIDKGNRTDPTKQADALDTVRYWCNTELSWFIRSFN